MANKHFSVEQLIWQAPPGWQRTQAEFSVIIERLVEALSEYLQQQIETVDQTLEESIIDDESFCCSIRSSNTFATPFDLAWEGILGMELIEGEPHVSASIFLFSKDSRLGLVGHEGSYLELVYQRSDIGAGYWSSLGWIDDIYGEFNNISKSVKHI